MTNENEVLNLDAYTKIPDPNAQNITNVRHSSQRATISATLKMNNDEMLQAIYDELVIISHEDANIHVEENHKKTAEEHSSSESLLRYSLRAVGTTPKDNAYDYDLIQSDKGIFLSPAKNASNFLSKTPGIAQDIKLETTYSEKNTVLFFMDGKPLDLLYIDLSDTTSEGSEGAHEHIIRQFILQNLLSKMLIEDLKYSTEKASVAINEIIALNAKLQKGKNTLELTADQIKKALKITSSTPIAITKLCETFQTTSIDSYENGEEIQKKSINAMGTQELRDCLIEIMNQSNIECGWGSGKTLEKIQAPKALFAKNLLCVVVEFFVTNTIVGLDISYFTNQKTLSVDSLNAKIDVDILVLMSLAALYTAYYFRNLYITQETRRFKDALPESFGKTESIAHQHIAKESNAFAAQTGVIALFGALLASNKSYEGIHYEGILMAAGILAVALPLVTYVAERKSNIPDNKKSNLGHLILFGLVIGALNYVIAATMAPVELPKQFDWFNCSTNTGRLVTFGFGLAGYYGAVRHMGNSAANEAVATAKNKPAATA